MHHMLRRAKEVSYSGHPGWANISWSFSWMASLRLPTYNPEPHKWHKFRYHPRRCWQRHSSSPCQNVQTTQSLWSVSTLHKVPSCLAAETPHSALRLPQQRGVGPMEQAWWTGANCLILQGNRWCSTLFQRTIGANIYELHLCFKK